MVFNSYFKKSSVFSRFVFVLSFLFILNQLQAQSLQSDIHLRAGLSQPILKYASTNLSEGGFTSSGFSGSLAINSLINNKIGLHIQGGLQLHPLDVSELGYALVQSDPFLTDVYIRSEPYRIIHFTAGPVYRMKLLKNTSLDMRLMGGIFNSYSPYQLYKPVYYLHGPPYYEITTSLSRTFAYGGGLSIIQNLGGCYYLALETDFLYSKAQFQFYGSGGLRTDSQHISFINTHISLHIVLPDIQLSRQKK